VKFLAAVCIVISGVGYGDAWLIMGGVFLMLYSPED
jgi:hypothetical protein